MFSVVTLKSSVNGLLTEMFAGWKRGYFESFPTCDLSLCPLWTASNIRMLQGQLSGGKSEGVDRKRS